MSFTYANGRAERTNVSAALNIYLCFAGFEVRNDSYARKNLGFHIVDDFGNLVPVTLNRTSLS